ncbi:MAG TPA: heparin lyase I family protein [Terriglobales bacterium]|nr:heparin lyase I family protein [Terriglobales bacterium]
MKRLLRVAAAFLIVLLLSLYALRFIPIHVYDGFESPHLSHCRWSSYRFAPGAVTPERSIVRSGHQALAITVHSGDRYEAASEEGAATERAELMEAWWLVSRPGRIYTYSFSLFLPKDLPQTSERLVIAQWKQLCWRCHPDNPVIAIRLENARLLITRTGLHSRIVLYQGEEDVRGRWLDFRFVIKFENGNHGSIDATLDGHDIVHYRGPTLYRPARGYSPEKTLIYFKTGLYRDALHEPPWTMYVDEYRKDECPDQGSC